MATRGKQEVVVQEVGGQVPAVFSSESMAAAMEMGKLAGRMEMASFFGSVSDKALVETYISMKEGKKYLGLPYNKKDGTSGNVSDLEEFCEAYLGRTYRRIRQLEQTYYLLGADLYEKSETIGLTSRDYAAIRALPEDDQQIVRDAIANSDRDQVIGLMQEMAAKHHRDKEAAAERIRVLEAKTKAGEVMLKEKDDKLRETFLELQTMKNYTPSEQVDFMDLQKVRALQSCGNGVDLALAQLAVAIGDYLYEGVTETKETNVIGLMAFLGERFNEVLRTHQIRLNFQDIINPPYEIDLFGASLVVGRRADGE